MKNRIAYFVYLLIVLAACGISAAEYDIGVYYFYRPMNDPCNPNHVNYDYDLMNLARNGCTKLFVSGNSLYDAAFWATVRNWGMKGATAYNILNGVGTDPVIDDGALSAEILSEKALIDNLNYMGPVGDAVVGKMICDEPECGGLTEGQKNYLRRYCYLYRQLQPTRQTYINHCDPPWYDLDEDRPTCSTGPTIHYNQSRITARVTEAQRLGYSTFTAVAQVNRIADWMNRNCDNIYWYGFGPCTEGQLNWLASRTTYQDTVEEVNTPYLNGADGVMAYQYGDNTPGTNVWSMVDVNGNDPWLKMKGFSDSARGIRAVQGWPTVGLWRYVGRRLPLMPLYDRRKYPAGSMTLVATYSGTAITKIVYGMSTMGGTSWTTIETNPGESATFTLAAGTTVILRAQAVDTLGRKSIWAAYMLKVVNASQLACGDYESSLLTGDINKDCRVDFTDCAKMAEAWLLCDDPNRAECGVWDNQHQFKCGQTGSGHPGLTADVTGDCSVGFKDFARIASDWSKCDDPVMTNCP